MVDLKPLWVHFAHRYAGLTGLVALSTLSTLLVAFLFPLFLGAVAKHGAKPWIIVWFCVGVVWLTATTFASVHVEIDLRVQSTHYVHSLFLKHTYLHYDYSPGAVNPTMKDLQSARSAFVGLSKLAAHTYVPFLLGNLGSAVYVLSQDRLAGGWFTATYLWTVAFPFLVRGYCREDKQYFTGAERSLFLGTQLVLAQTGARRAFANERCPDRYLASLHSSFARSAGDVTRRLLYQSGVFLLGLALLSVGLLYALRRTSLANSTRVTILSMFVFNLKQVGKYLEDVGEFVKYTEELQRALPAGYASTLDHCSRTKRGGPTPAAAGAPPPGGTVLSIRDLQYQYSSGKNVFLRGPLTFECRAGERVAVLGTNGCGKSTLLQLVAHRLRARGVVHVLDQAFEDELAAAAYVAYYTQNQLGWELWSVRDNLRFAVEDRDADGLAAQLQAWGVEWVVLEFAGGYDTPLSDLSLGQRQFVAVLQVLLRGSKLLLLDEPTSAMNARYSRELARVLREHPDFQQCAILFVTHDAEFCTALATSTLQLG